MTPSGSRRAWRPFWRSSTNHCCLANSSIDQQAIVNPLQSSISKQQSSLLIARREIVTGRRLSIIVPYKLSAVCPISAIKIAFWPYRPQLIDLKVSLANINHKRRTVLLELRVEAKSSRSAAIHLRILEKHPVS